MPASTATATATAGLEISLNGRSYGFVATKAIASVSKVFEDTLYVADAVYSTILTIGSVGGARLATLKDALIVNNEASLPINVMLSDTGGDQIIKQIPAGQFEFVNSILIEAKTDGSGYTGTSNIDTIEVAGVGGSCSVSIVAMGT